MTGEQRYIGLRTHGRIIRENPECGRAEAAFFRRRSKKFPSEQGFNGAVVEFLAGAEKRARVVGAIAWRRSGASGANFGIREWQGLARGEKHVDLLIVGAAEEEHR